MTDRPQPGPGSPGLRIVEGGDRRAGTGAPPPEGRDRRRATAAPNGPRIVGDGPALVPVAVPEPPPPGGTWSEQEAEAWLAARDLVGWRFSLDRIERLLARLGDPQLGAPSVHIVGTNGKSSTTRMVAALLAAHGHRPGAFLSPHLTHLRERIEIDGSPVDPQLHAAAVAEVARAVPHVDAPGDPVTQFEAHVATAFVAMAAAGCDVLVIEAGLGGRLDATNVLDAPVVALTSVALEHTELLGDTVAEITAEKVAVVSAGSTLVLGPRLDDEATIVARDHAAQIGARVVTARVEPVDARLGAAFQQANFATARAVLEAYLGQGDLRAVREVAAAFAMPARFELLGQHPTTILDGAHNPAGARALATALEEAGHTSGGVAVLSVLSDKDAEGIAAALAGICDRFVLCDCGAARAMPTEELARRVARVVPAGRITQVSDPAAALVAARTLAAPDGVVVVCGTLELARAVRAHARPGQETS